MNRIYEELAHSCVLAPQTVAAATEKTSAFVDAAGADELEFLVSAAALGAGKSLTAAVYGAASADGAGGVKLGEAVFTDPVGTGPVLAAVSVRPAAASGRYIGLKIQHDGTAAVVCGATVSVRTRRLPAPNGWTLAV